MSHKNPNNSTESLPLPGVKSVVLLICVIAAAMFLAFGGWGSSPAASKLSSGQSHLYTGMLQSAKLKLLPPTQGIYQSAFPNNCAGEDCVGDARNATSFARETGKSLVWDEFSDNWTQGIKFPLAKVDAIWSRGIIPYIRLMPRSNWQVGCNAKNPYSLQRIIDGDYDTQLTAYAQAARDTGLAMLMDFAPEANGNWYPWSGACNGAGSKTGFGNPALADGPERFAAAYRHVISLFTRAGARNITWFAHYAAYDKPVASWNKMQAYYPGDHYIEWAGISAMGAQKASDLKNWNPSLARVVQDNYSELSRVSAHRPLAILKWGDVAGGKNPTQAQFVSGALAALSTNKWPRIKAISYWDLSWDNGGSIGWSRMRLGASPATLRAYRQGIAHPFFVSSARLTPSKASPSPFLGLIKPHLPGSSTAGPFSACAPEFC